MYVSFAIFVAPNWRDGPGGIDLDLILVAILGCVRVGQVNLGNFQLFSGLHLAYSHHCCGWVDYVVGG